MRIKQQVLVFGLFLCLTQLAAKAETSTTAPLLSASASIVGVESETKAMVLYGHAEVNDAPNVELFADLIWRQHGLPCETRNSMSRLLRVAHDEQMRQTVWKRMQQQELYWVSNKVLSQIEQTAAMCNMPLVR